jgi:ATP:cob(I)alamin adenosyltransferase
MSIYTRGGDTGQTSLLGGSRVAKDDLRIEIYGTLDEATSALGLARAATKSDNICRTIIDLQGELIKVMSELATKPVDEAAAQKLKLAPVQPAQVERLEKLIDGYETERIATGQFVRPGGSLASAALDLARTMVRRAERRLISLTRQEEVNPNLVKYLNRLSDLLYVMARIDEQREIEQVVVASLRGATGAAPVEENRGKSGVSLADGDRMIEAGMRRSREIGVPMVLTVVDNSGNIIQTRRMDGALGVSLELAPHKAFTAAAVRMPTHELAKLAQPGAPLFGIDVNMPRLTLVGGGLPLQVAGQVVGAVGVSGGSVEQDLDVAQAMAAAF